MRIRGKMNDTVCVACGISGNDRVRSVVSGEPYTLERSDVAPEA